jgi:hypothetical protein
MPAPLMLLPARAETRSVMATHSILSAGFGRGNETADRTTVTGVGTMARIHLDRPTVRPTDRYDVE